jgi:hypothetical protein
MGNYSGATQTVYQIVTFPSNLISASLSFYYQTVSANPLGDDALQVQIRDTNNYFLTQLAYTYSGYTNASYAFFNTNFAVYPGSNTLSSYAGKTVEVYLAAETDPTYGYLTSFYLTDVSLLVGTTADIPANDNFANAMVIPPTGLTNAVNTTYGSKEPGETNHAGNVGGHSVWWNWTAPGLGVVNIGTAGSGFITLLGVYTGNSVSNLTAVASSNGGSVASRRAAVRFNPVPGTQYFIALDGYNGQSGAADFAFTYAPDTTPPTFNTTSPANNSAVTNSTVVIKGTANDNVAVASVSYSLANVTGTNAWQPATSTNLFTNWTATVTDLIPGTNLVRFQAVDTSTNATAVQSLLLNYYFPVPLTLSTNGRGTVSGATNNQLLDLNYPYQLTARPAAGFGFAGWTGSIVTNSSVLSFVMQSNLSFTANFVNTAPPTFHITSPANNSAVTNSAVLIRGTANDNIAVASVNYSLVNSAGSNAWQVATSTNLFTNWTATVTNLIPGTNLVRLQGVDTSGIAAAVQTVLLTYYVPLPLTLSTIGHGTITGATNQQLLGLNYPYHLTAHPAAGFGFAGWTGSFATNSSNLSFVMQSNLSFTANFADVQRPSVTFSAPTAGERLSNGVFQITGKAADNVAVASVSYQLNGGAWLPATPGNSAFTNWTAGVTLSPGSNYVRACSVDTTGNFSPTNQVGFLFIPSAVISVQTNGSGTIARNNSSALLAVGTNYTFTAYPARNWIFSNWVAGGSGSFVSNGPVLKFPMQSNLVLTANFVTNFFLAAQGSYYGLFAPANEARSQSNSGYATITVTGTGAFSGSLTIGAQSTPLVDGQFDVSGYAVVSAARRGTMALITTLQLDLANHSLSGRVTDGTFVADLSADQAVFTTAHPATNFAGQFTLVIPGTNDPAVGPLGVSYGTVTVLPTGAVTFAGALADGTPVNESSTVSKDGNWPFYLSLYNGAGSIWGTNYFTNQTLLAAPALSWINTTNSARTALYRAGFTNQQVSIVSSYFDPTNAPLLDLPAAQVTLTGGNLPFTIVNQIDISSRNVVTVPHTAGNTNHLALSIGRTGLITGSIQNPTNARLSIAVSGVVLQNQTNAQGYFPGTNESGTFLIEAP